MVLLYSPYGEYSKAFLHFFFLARWAGAGGSGHALHGDKTARSRNPLVTIVALRAAHSRYWGSPSGGGCVSIPHERASGGLEGGRRPVPQGLRRIAAPGRASRFLSQLRQKCPIGTSGQAQKKGLCAPRDRSFHGDKESLARLKAVPTPYPLKTRPCSPLRLR